MSHSLRRLGFLLVLAVIFVVAPVQATAPKRVVDQLREHYQRSSVEVQSAPIVGRVFGSGVVLIVQEEGVTANPLRISQLNPKSPRFHVGDFASVDVGKDGRIAAPAAAFTLPKGTRLVVLDLKVDPGAVRLFTHTVERVSVASGRPVYGCTEFIFRFDPAVLERGDVLAIERRIEEWVPRLEGRNG